MTCKFCGKKSAQLVLIEIYSGTKPITTHYCWKCIQKNPEIKSILDTFLKIKKKPATSTIKKCFFCGSTLSDLKRSGFVGCAMCYESFRSYIIKEIKKLHSNLFHRGKFPLGVSNRQAFFNNLEDRMKIAVEKQDLEEIAEIRKEVEIFFKNV